MLTLKSFYFVNIPFIVTTYKLIIFDNVLVFIANPQVNFHSVNGFAYCNFVTLYCGDEVVINLPIIQIL